MFLFSSLSKEKKQDIESLKDSLVRLGCTGKYDLPSPSLFYNTTLSMLSNIKTREEIEAFFKDYDFVNSHTDLLEQIQNTSSKEYKHYKSYVSPQSEYFVKYLSKDPFIQKYLSINISTNLYFNEQYKVFYFFGYNNDLDKKPLSIAGPLEGSDSIFTSLGYKKYEFCFNKNNYYEIRNRNTKKVIMEVHKSSLVKCPIEIRGNNDFWIEKIEGEVSPLYCVKSNHVFTKDKILLRVNPAYDSDDRIYFRFNYFIDDTIEDGEPLDMKDSFELSFCLATVISLIEFGLII